MEINGNPNLIRTVKQQLETEDMTQVGKGGAGVNHAGKFTKTQQDESIFSILDVEQQPDNREHMLEELERQASIFERPIIQKHEIIEKQLSDLHKEETLGDIQTAATKLGQDAGQVKFEKDSNRVEPSSITWS